ncbi:MAG: hypothetical protein ACJAZP_000939 [Psychromonas sp.]|jgi:hypothetical protein
MIECSSRLISADFSFAIIDYFINPFAIRTWSKTNKFVKEGLEQEPVYQADLLWSSFLMLLIFDR